ncbi:hypothetical protein BGZ63DRAFT_267860 [Mariannaea sp. PMI_226]|nr:hypothetical protein BGZ63DRAFT_267860 [Mariannaea sp. PMI_226]
MASVSPHSLPSALLCVCIAACPYPCLFKALIICTSVRCSRSLTASSSSHSKPRKFTGICTLQVKRSLVYICVCVRVCMCVCVYVTITSRPQKPLQLRGIGIREYLHTHTCDTQNYTPLLFFLSPSLSSGSKIQ